MISWKLKEETFKLINVNSVTLAGMAQWIECLTASQRVSGSIPSQGTYLGCVWARSPVGGAQEATTHYVSLPFFLLPFPYLKINKIFE